MYFQFTFLQSYEWIGTAELTDHAIELGFSAGQIIDGLQSGELHLNTSSGEFVAIMKTESCLATISSAVPTGAATRYSNFVGKEPTGD
jgi:hypothetical protein